MDLHACKLAILVWDTTDELQELLLLLYIMSNTYFQGKYYSSNQQKDLCGVPNVCTDIVKSFHESCFKGRQSFIANSESPLSANNNNYPTLGHECLHFFSTNPWAQKTMFCYSHNATKCHWSGSLSLLKTLQL